MALLPAALLVPLLVFVTATGPGFLLTRRLSWTSSERLCAAIGLSLVWTYLATLALRTIAAGSSLHGLHLGLACMNGLAAAACWRTYPLLWRSRAVRTMVVAYAVVLVWLALHLVSVRNISGGAWANDPYEHFERCRVLLGDLPLGHRLLGLYSLPARPPLMNAVGAHILALVGSRYELYQVCFLVLNAAVVLPCLLLAPALSTHPLRRRWPVVLTALLALCPMFVQNHTFSWTRPLAAFYVILAFALYLAAVRRREPTRMVGAFVALAAGALVHYSVGPYIVALGMHYVVCELRRRRAPWRELGASLVLAGLCLGTWIGWSASVFGLGETVGANTTAWSVRGHGVGDALLAVATNLVDTLVPHFLRGVPLEAIHQASTLGFARDLAFLVYQVNLPMALGVAGGPTVLWLLWRRLCRPLSSTSAAAGAPTRAARARALWLWCITCVTTLGVAVVGDRYPTGLAHICLQPLVFLGVVFLAVEAPALPRWARAALVVGCLVDLVLGIELHASMSAVAMQFDRIPAPGGAWITEDSLPHHVALAAWSKTQAGIAFLGDHLGQGTWFTLTLGAVAGGGLLFALARSLFDAPRAKADGEVSRATAAAGPRGTSGGSAGATPAA